MKALNIFQPASGIDVLLKLLQLCCCCCKRHWCRKASLLVKFIEVLTEKLGLGHAAYCTALWWQSGYWQWMNHGKFGHHAVEGEKHHFIISALEQMFGSNCHISTMSFYDWCFFQHFFPLFGRAGSSIFRHCNSIAASSRFSAGKIRNFYECKITEFTQSFDDLEEFRLGKSSSLQPGFTRANR